MLRRLCRRLGAGVVGVVAVLALATGTARAANTVELGDEVSVQVAGGTGGIHGSPLKSRVRASIAEMSCLRVVDR